MGVENGVALIEYGTSLTLNSEFPDNLATTPMVILPKELKARPKKDTCIPMFTTALVTTVKRLEQPKCLLIGKWMSKTLCSALEYHSAIKRRKIQTYALTRMNLDNITIIIPLIKDTYHTVHLDEILN